MPGRLRPLGWPGLEELTVVMIYGLFQWAFLVLAFVCGISALLRQEVFSTNTSQRAHHHSDQQFLLWIVCVVFLVAGFVAAVLAANHGMR
jgi:hypothetical protein